MKEVLSSLFGFGRALRPDGTTTLRPDGIKLQQRTMIESYAREYTNKGVRIIPIMVRPLPGVSRGKGGKQAHRKSGVRAIRRAAGKL